MPENKRIDAAIEYKHNGYNCAQAVVMAHNDLLNTDKNILLNITSGLGMGMGCMEATCGALYGAVVTAGIIRNGEQTTTISKQLLQRFKEKSGATICKDLKGIETSKMICSCDDCVKNAVEALSEVMNLKEINV